MLGDHSWADLAYHLNKKRRDEIMDVTMCSFYSKELLYKAIEETWSCKS